MNLSPRELFFDFLDRCDYQLIEGSEFLWSCYPGARFYTCMVPWGTANLVADFQHNRLYEITVHRETTGEDDQLDDPHVAYRWIHEDYRQAQRDESATRGLHWEDCGENSRYITTDCVDDILDKVKGIMRNEPYERTVVWQFDIDEDLKQQCQQAAERLGITENEFYVQAIRAVINQENPDEKPVD